MKRREEEIGEGWMVRLERLLEFNFNRYDRFWKLSMHRGGGGEGGFELLVRCMEGLICEEI